MTSPGRWVDRLEEHARKSLAEPVLNHLVHGAGDSLTSSEAAEAWRQVRFQPHVLRDVTTVDPSVQVLGQRFAVPWGVAPTSPQLAFHPEGELAMARATAAAGSLLVVSSNAGTRFAQIGETGAEWWLQAYLSADRTLCEPMLAHAVEAGASAVVLTVDTPVVGSKRPTPSVWETIDPAIVRANFDDDYEGRVGSEKALDLGPHDIGWLAGITGLPVVVKGVLRAEDARRCVQAGADAVWVSNHGGRQLDRAQATAHCLEGVLEAVHGEAEVYVDGGLRTGLDILAGLALGADQVFLGRLPLLALVDGESGVSGMHAELLRELLEAMRLAGCRTVADTRGLAARVRPNSL